jgi:hypothetical protein
MEHPVAWDDHPGILEHQVAVSERPEVRLPSAEDDRHDVDRHVVDEPQRQRLPADLTRARADLPLASQLLCSPLIPTVTPTVVFLLRTTGECGADHVSIRGEG